MKISVFGAGYVGLVAATCFASVGNEVVCVDVDEEKVAALNKGLLPIYEPGLDELVLQNCAAGRLCFTTGVEKAVHHADLQIIAVGTPGDEGGAADISQVLAVARSIAHYAEHAVVVVTKSTVPVGTAAAVVAEMGVKFAQRGVTIPFDVVSNPEFLKEGDALGDFMKPDRIIVGLGRDELMPLFKQLYAPFNRNKDRLLFMDVRSAELTKYAANGMLATKISFMNELSQLAERLGADIESVRLGLAEDPRIGRHFIYPGCGFGGSCFPKDIRALLETAKGVNFDASLLRAVDEVNVRQKRTLFDKINRYFAGVLEGKVFALWGLAFKPNTDDLREASSGVLMEALWQAGARVQAFDPVAMEQAKQRYGGLSSLSYGDSPYDVLEGASALVIATEWNVFRSPDFSKIRAMLLSPVIFDGRNIYDPEYVKQQGLSYFAIGRGDSCKVG